MTPEQKQLEQIRERARVKYQNAKLGEPFEEPCPGCGCVTFAAARKDIDFLLSLVKSQEAVIASLTTQWCQCGHTKDKHGFFSDHDECYECDQASPDLCCEWRPAPRPDEKSSADTATAMRSACVEKVKAIAESWAKSIEDQWDDRPDLSFDAAERLKAAGEIVSALESLSIEKTKE